MPKKKKRTSLGKRKKYYYLPKSTGIDEKLECSDSFETCKETDPAHCHKETDPAQCRQETESAQCHTLMPTTKDHNYTLQEVEVSKHSFDIEKNNVDSSVVSDHDQVTDMVNNIHTTDFGAEYDHQYSLPSTFHHNASSATETFNSWFKTLGDEIKNILPSPFISLVNEDRIEILELYKQEGRTSVKMLINIDKNACATIHVHRRELSTDHELWTGLPYKFDSKDKILLLLKRLSKFEVCMGNPDEEFHDLTPIGSGLSDASSSEIYAYREGDFSAQLGEKKYFSTIRSTHCALLVDGRRCCKCAQYRRCLWARKHRLAEKSNHSNNDLIHSTYKHRDMNRDMLISKIKQQQKVISGLQNEVERQRRNIDRQILQAGVVMPEYQNGEMADLLHSCKDDIERAFPNPDSLQRLFWEQQVKFVKSGKNGMRWHPMIIRWCLYLRHKSSSAYDALRDSGFVKLPSARTLFDYSHYVKSALGFQEDVIKMLKEEAVKKSMLNEHESHKCYVGILFDEIRVKEDLVYDKHTGELVGYCNLDTIGNQVLELEKLNKSDKKSETAKCILVLMLRGLSTDLKFPLAGFATNNISADFLYPIIWKAVYILEEIVRLKVLFLTCDGASANRRFFNLHRVDDDQLLIHYTVNPHDKARKIYFISDVPHLVKTTRNCFSNSFAHKNTRKMWKDGKDISWLHVLRLYEEHCEVAIYNPCPKLTRAHIDMTAFGCMKVNLAAQVLSSSVANALEDLYDDHVSETVEFIRNFNKFFDCLNVRSLYEGRNKRNADLNPYKEVNDPRLEWLKSDFLGYLDNWNTSVQNRPGIFTKSQQTGMKLSSQTITGLKMSVNSIVECVQIMLNSGANFVLTHHFNQDPIEQHFGHYRHRGGNNNNPTVYDVRNTMTQMRTIGAQALAPRHGNVKRDNEENIRPIDNSKLPKRRK